MNGPHMQFFGNLTQDPEQRYTKNEGIPYARLRVAQHLPPRTAD